MNKNRVLILSLATAFVLACSLMGKPQTTQQPVSELPTYTPYPTYTPQATYTVPPPQAGGVTQAAGQTATLATSNSVKYNAIQIQPKISVFGNTKDNNVMYYFEGQQGQIISLVLVGDPRYQEFSLRDSNNNGLIGCDIKSQNICSITDFKLPYTGMYYVLVDRTFVDNYKQLQSCVNNPPYASWCYRGGPFSLDLIIN